MKQFATRQSNLKRSTNRNNKFIATVLSAVLLGMAILVSVPLAVQAQSAQTPLVPCTGIDCNVCHLYEGARRVINFLLYDITLPMFVVAILWGGILWLTSGGSEQRISQGREILWYALIGMLIAFGAWVIVNTLLDTLGFKIPGRGNWNNTNICSELNTINGSISAPSPAQPGAGTTPTTPVAGTLSDTQVRQQLTTANISTNAQCPQTCFNGFQQSALNEALALRQQCPTCTIQISGGVDSPGVHGETGSCTHISGCKFDISGSNTNLNNYITNNYTPRAPTFGVAQYVAPNGAIYTKEANGSWDITPKI